MGYCRKINFSEDAFMSNNKGTKVETPACIVCGEGGRMRRGLCDSHYMMFQRSLKQVPAEKQDAYEDSLVASGKLLPNRQGQKSSTNNPFMEAAREFLEPHQKEIAARAEALAEKLDKPKRKGKE
jgi:hypothetical protein